ncbi:MAG: Rho termination factor N-terminal domain-containing protein [Thainema sp.]
MSDRYEKKYTKPDLRREIKDDLMQSDKGGKPGQWSARKSQLLVQEYEKQGGGYKNDEKDESAKSLEQWSEEDWQTQGGSSKARQDDKTKRYLPKAVWDKLSDSEKKEAEKSKRKASKNGQQHVEWPDAVQKAMDEFKQEQSSSGSSDSDNEPTKEELYEQAQEMEISGRSSMKKDELKQAVQSAQADADELDEKTCEELYEQAQELEIEGRSKMNKDELKNAIASQD